MIMYGTCAKDSPELIREFVTSFLSVHMNFGQLRIQATFHLPKIARFDLFTNLIFLSTKSGERDFT